MSGDGEDILTLCVVYPMWGNVGIDGKSCSISIEGAQTASHARPK